MLTVTESDDRITVDNDKMYFSTAPAINIFRRIAIAMDDTKYGFIGWSNTNDHTRTSANVFQKDGKKGIHFINYIDDAELPYISGNSNNSNYSFQIGNVIHKVANDIAVPGVMIKRADNKYACGIIVDPDENNFEFIKKEGDYEEIITFDQLKQLVDSIPSNTNNARNAINKCNFKFNDEDEFEII